MVFRSLFNRKRSPKKEKNNHDLKEDFTLNVSENIQTNIDNLNNMLDEPNDLKIRTLKLGDANIECAVAYIEGIVNELSIQMNILGNIEDEQHLPDKPQDLFDNLYYKQIAMNDVEKVSTLDDVSFAILSGKTIVYVDGVNMAFTIETIGGELRGIEEPLAETLIRGPRSGFVEVLQVNLALIRREVKDPNMRLKTYQAGRRSKRNIVIAYVDGIVNPKLVDEVNRRLKSLDMDMVLGSGYVEEWIEDSFLSPFPQIMDTERPDIVAKAIMEGKVAILVEGTPFTLVLPISFPNAIQSPEDYYERWILGSLLRILRYFGAFISVFLPSLYIALLSMQPGMIPSELVFSIAGTREGVPFPPIIEALLMLITMELLQEAGARLPQTIGQTVGIVGGLVIGEAAVQAGIVSPIMVIVVALTAISNFAIPLYSVAVSLRIIRFAFMIAAAALGLYGIILLYIMINIHIVNLKSFGVPYSTPFSPFFKSEWKDAIFRSPIPTIAKRSKSVQPEDDTKVSRKGERK